jgi:hypothetical protein
MWAGESTQASQNKRLGAFRLKNIPLAPCAATQVAVTFIGTPWAPLRLICERLIRVLMHFVLMPAVTSDPL